MSMIKFVLRSLIAIWCSAVAADPCNGRYNSAAGLIERAYSNQGTLYSGGAAYSSVGPTLEIYRMLVGLPDSGMASAQSRTLPFKDTPRPPGPRDPAFTHTSLRTSLARIHDPNFQRDGKGWTTDSEVLLNDLTVIGPYPGWWLTPDAPHLTTIEKVIASHAKDDALDWLLSVQAASARPFKLAWRLQTNFRDGRAAASRILLAHALDRYAETQSLAWFLAVHLAREDWSWEHRLSETQRDTLRSIHRRQIQLNASVAECTASNADYVAFSVGSFEGLRLSSNRYSPRADLESAALMPMILRRMAAVQLAKVSMNDLWRRKNHLTPETILALYSDPQFHSWLNVGRSYRARSLSDLVTINAGVALEPKTIRFLNILSVDDLLTFASSRQEFPKEYRDLKTVAFLRLIAMERDAEAADLVNDIAVLWPEQHDALKAAWAQNGTLGYRLVKVALVLPEPRTLLVPRWNSWADHGDFSKTLHLDRGLAYWASIRRSLDLPVSIRTGGFVTRDFRVWMTANGGSRFSDVSATRRNWRRGFRYPDPLIGLEVMPNRNLGLFYRWNGRGPALFAGWDELSQLGPETGLANRIGRELILNSRAQTSNRLRRLFVDKEELASEMAFVIQQGRRMISGEMEGRPLGQVAFEVLHGPLAKTEAALRTPYWYICKERCEP